MAVFVSALVFVNSQINKRGTSKQGNMDRRSRSRSRDRERNDRGGDRRRGDFARDHAKQAILPRFRINMRRLRSDAS